LDWEVLFWKKLPCGRKGIQDSEQVRIEVLNPRPIEKAFRSVCVKRKELHQESKPQRRVFEKEEVLFQNQQDFSRPLQFKFPSSSLYFYSRKKRRVPCSKKTSIKSAINKINSLISMPNFLFFSLLLFLSILSSFSSNPIKQIWANGNNQNGQLGIEGWIDPTIFSQVQTQNTSLDEKKIIYISAGRSHSLALSSDGLVFAWGDNSNGQLGDATNQNRNQPIQVQTQNTSMNGKQIIYISAGGFHSLALSSDGLVFAWGYNSNGELGDGTNQNRNEPIQVQTQNTSMNGKQIIYISTGRFHSLALSSDGLVFAWGDNSNGELGDATNQNRNEPIQIQTQNTSMNGKNIASISAGGFHSLALSSDGLVFSWGYNSNGELGDGTNQNRNEPIQIQKTSMNGKNILLLFQQEDFIH
jgi:CRP-like cAMP-binding protein